MKTVKATREGLLGGHTSSGWRVNRDAPGVALPSVAALHLWIAILNVENGKETVGLVLDVGPWNVDDDAYVFGDAQPQAESGRDRFGRKTNGAGIDLGERVWRELVMTDNGLVSWRWLWEPVSGPAPARPIPRPGPLKG